MYVTVENCGDTAVFLNFKRLLPGERRRVAQGVAEAVKAQYPALHIIDDEPEQSPTTESAIDTTPTDNLKAIRGIGDSTAEELATLGILTFRALADADTATLAEQVNGSERQVAGWQRQAREKATWQ